MLKNKIYTCIATHDKVLVNSAYKLLEKYNVPKNKYEFQMLLGVDEELRRILLTAGHRLRVYVPFGSQWYPYSTRRLKENPQIAGYVLQNIFKHSS